MPDTSPTDTLPTDTLPTDTSPTDQAPPGARQELAVYFDPAFAEALETWGADNVWREIQILLAGRQGRALDLGCGVGRTYDFLKHSLGLEYHGCDISRLLIDRAAARGVPDGRLKVADATRLPYPDGHFDHVFSIGSLEHFTGEGIVAALREARRVCRGFCFHQMPVTRSPENEGWITCIQSYWNNTRGWWEERFVEAGCGVPYIMESRWSDSRSTGLWFIVPADGALSQG